MVGSFVALVRDAFPLVGDPFALVAPVVLPAPDWQSQQARLAASVRGTQPSSGRSGSFPTGLRTGVERIGAVRSLHGALKSGVRALRTRQRVLHLSRFASAVLPRRCYRTGLVEDSQMLRVVGSGRPKQREDGRPIESGDCGISRALSALVGPRRCPLIADFAEMGGVQLMQRNDVRLCRIGPDPLQSRVRLLRVPDPPGRDSAFLTASDCGRRFAATLGVRRPRAALRVCSDWIRHNPGCGELRRRRISR